MKKIFAIDWMMLISFIPAVCSGIGLHVAGHGPDSEVWHGWAVFHAAASLLFLVAAIAHIRTHWGWYRGVARAGIGRKSRVTAGLSVVFAVVVVTGIILLGVEGPGSSVGLWHYRLGLAAGALSLGHALKRRAVLRKSLERGSRRSVR